MMKLFPRPALLLAAALFAGATGFAALILPMPTDAAIGPSGAGANLAAAQCRVRIAEAGRGFSVTLAGLAAVAGAPAPQRCAAYRAHVAALVDARDVYAACLTGFARDGQVSQVELAARDWRAAIAVRCGN